MNPSHSPLLFFFLCFSFFFLPSHAQLPYPTSAPDSNTPNPYFECTPKEACIVNTIPTNSTTNITTIISELVCAPGYQGQYCTQCSPNYYRLNVRCNSCPYGSVGLGGYWPLLFFVLIMLVFLLWCIAVPNFKTIHTLTIAISAIQLISFFSEIDTSWTSTMYRTFAALGLVNFNVNFFALECAGDAASMNYWVRWYFRIFLPVILWCLLALVYGMIKCLKNKRTLRWTRCCFTVTPFHRRNSVGNIGNDSNNSGNNSAEIDYSDDEALNLSLRNRFVFATVLLFDFFYTNMCQTTSEIFNCEYVIDHYVVRSEPSITCYNSQWTKNSVWAYFMILFYAAGTPIILGLILFWNRNRKTSPFYLYRYSSLSKPFLSTCHYWHLFTLFERGIIILLINLGGRGISIYFRVNLALFVLICYLFFQVKISPYQFQAHNRLRVMWNLVAIYWLYSALVFDKLNDPHVLLLNLPNHEYHLKVFTDFLLASLILVILLTVFYCILEYRRYRGSKKLSTLSDESPEQLDSRNEKLLQFLLPTTSSKVWLWVQRMPLVTKNKFIRELEGLCKFDEQKLEIVQAPNILRKPAALLRKVKKANSSSSGKSAELSGVNTQIRVFQVVKTNDQKRQDEQEMEEEEKSRKNASKNTTSTADNNNTNAISRTGVSGTFRRRGDVELSDRNPFDEENGGGSNRNETSISIRSSSYQDAEIDPPSRTSRNNNSRRGAY